MSLENYKKRLREFTELNRIAKSAGLTGPWLCWENGRVSSEFELEALMEICLRIEQIEKTLGEIMLKMNIPEKRNP